MTTEQKYQVIATTLMTMFLPGLVLGIVSCWHRGIHKTFLTHPSIIFMPTFTHFTFASSTKWCKGIVKKERDDEGEEKEEEGGKGESRGEPETPYITFSAKLTLANVILSAVGSVSYCLILAHISAVVRETHMGQGNAKWEMIGSSRIPYLLYYYLYNPRANIPFIIQAPTLGPFLSLLSLVFISRSLPSWYHCPLPTCCSTCFSLPKVEYGALVPSQNHLDFVLDANHEPKLVPEYEEVKLEKVTNEESEIAGNEEAETVEKQGDKMAEPGQDRDNYENSIPSKH